MQPSCTLSSGKKMRVDAARSWKMRRYCRRKPSEKDISFAPSPSPVASGQVERYCSKPAVLPSVIQRTCVP